ncbi:MAG: choice-of-anchor M domain-containing protein [Myxococcales bacterium]|nr:choice-of-anchor M domain-containing protein [Myxococcales bacterium]MDD9971377.1 choice-of-anchor M domain-containing protein [Myxococcales bacterium]
MGNSLGRDAAATIGVVLTLCGCAGDHAAERQRTHEQRGSGDRDGLVPEYASVESDRDAGDASAVDAAPFGPEYDSGSESDTSIGTNASTPSIMDAAIDAGTDSMPRDERRVGGRRSGPHAPRDAGLDAGGDAEIDARRGAAMGDPDTGVPCDVEYRAGHGDMHVTYDQAEGLRLHLRSHLVYPSPGGPEPLRDPAGICIVVPQSSRARVIEQGGRPADGAGFEPIGVEAGAAFWFLSNNNLGAEQPFWGLSTEGVDAVDVTGDVHFDTEQVDAPDGSGLAVYRVVGIEPQFVVATAEPSQTLSGFQRISMTPGSHDHYVWSFTHPGVYDVSVRARVTTRGGPTAESPLTTYRFLVEP